jgi:undecaprenyl-diphosphatase
MRSFLRRRVSLLRRVIAVGTLVASGATVADTNSLGIDHKVPLDESGIWSRKVQNAVEYGTVLAVLGGAVWFEAEGQPGHTFWQAVDSTVLGAATAAIMKPVFGRARPSQTDDPGEWFQGKGHNSFPSGEVMLVTTAVTPFIFEYGPRQPAAYALALLPIYDAVARVKAQAHWQTDVLASLAFGTGIGWYAHGRDVPIFVKLLPHGMTVGLHTQF